MRPMTSRADRDRRRQRVAGLGVERRGAEDERHQAADGQEAVARDGGLEDEEDDRQADEQEPADVERQAAEADEGEDEREGAQDAGHPVGVLELEEDAVEAEREEDEGDVRIGQQVEERLERVHRQALAPARPPCRRVALLAGHGRRSRPSDLGEEVLDASRP